MSVGGLTAVLFTREGPKVIDRIVSDVSFRSTDPGGFAGINLTLAVPVTRDDLAYSHIGIFDATTGEQVAAGQLPDGGQSPGFGQPVRELTAVGAGIGAMQNQKKPRIYIDSEPGAWVQAFSANKNLHWSMTESPSGGSFQTQVLDIAATNVYVGPKSDLRYHPIRSTDQLLGGYTFTHRAGRSSSNNRIEAYASTFADLTFDVTSDDPWSTSSTSGSAQLGGDWDLADARDNVFIRYRRNTSTLTVDEDLDWVEVFDLTVQGTRLNRAGEIMTSDALYTFGPTTPDIFTDVFARVEGVDALSARIDPDPGPVVPYRHVQLAWRQGVTDYAIANEVVEADQRYTWAVWGRQANGLYEAELRLKSTEPRYELSIDDDFVPAGDTGNAPRWLDEVWVVGPIDGGRVVARRVPAIDDLEPPAGAPRLVDTVSIPRFTAGDADVLATAKIRESYSTANAAKARVSRKVKDNLTGRMVEPYMIRPGYVCRVRGKRPESVDALNPSTVADSTLFRIASTNYRHSQGAVDLELNAYSLTEASAISSLATAIR